MTRYYVRAETTCRECDGRGIVTHPAWEHYWETHDAGIIDDDFEAWFEERGYSYPPDEEILCTACNGQGDLIEWVPLEDALKTLQPV